MPGKSKFIEIAKKIVAVATAVEDAETRVEDLITAHNDVGTVKAAQADVIAKRRLLARLLKKQARSR